MYMYMVLFIYYMYMQCQYGNLKAGLKQLVYPRALDLVIINQTKSSNNFSVFSIPFALAFYFCEYQTKTESDKKTIQAMMAFICENKITIRIYMPQERRKAPEVEAMGDFVCLFFREAFTIQQAWHHNYAQPFRCLVTGLY